MAYKVKSGDTLSQIAKNMGTTLKALMAANPQIKNANKIKPGQSIKTPTKTTTKTTSTPGKTIISVFGKDVEVKKVGDKHYRVKKDGTLAKNPVSKLQQANINNPKSDIVKRTGGKTRTTTTTASALPKSKNPYAGMSKSEMAAIAMKKKKPTALADKKKAAKKTQNLVASAVRKSNRNKG